MNKKEKLLGQYNAQQKLYPERTKEHNMLISLSRVVHRLLQEMSKGVAKLDQIKYQQEYIAKEFELVCEELKIDLEIGFYWMYMLKYHNSLVLLAMPYSKYKEDFPHYIKYLEEEFE